MTTWEKYLSKRSLIKHTCSWRDKLIVLIELLFIEKKFEYLHVTKKKEKGAFHEFNWVEAFPPVLYFLCQKG